MVAEVFSGMIQGIEGQIVQIQADISNGLPNFYMTGYLSNEVKESKERVRTALHNIGIALPPKRISVNFAPADFRKCGTFFDLAVAVAILLAMNLIPETYVKNTLFIGELSLNGQIRPISGVLPIVVSAVKSGIDRCIVAKENSSSSMQKEALVKEKIQEDVKTLNRKRLDSKENKRFQESIGEKRETTSDILGMHSKNREARDYLKSDDMDMSVRKSQQRKIDRIVERDMGNIRDAAKVITVCRYYHHGINSMHEYSFM